MLKVPKTQVPAGTGGMIDTVVMSGGAPQSPLMAGFLYEVLKAGKTFQSFHTSGAGALMALLFIAPKNGDACKALRNWVEAGVADDVYAGAPVNFKLFRKPGPFTPLFHFMAERLKVPRKGIPAATEDPIKKLLAEWLANKGPAPASSPTDRDALDRVVDRLQGMWTGTRNTTLYNQLIAGDDPIKRLRDAWLNSWLTDDDQKRAYNDLVELAFSAMTPSTLTFRSKGLAAPLPFLDEIVSFDKLKDLRVNRPDLHLCVNAYNMTEDARLGATIGKGRAHRNPNVMQIFDQTEIDAPHIRAAFSMPFIYPPARILDDYYSEGADHQPINFHDLATNKISGNIQAALLDVLGDLEDLLVRTPRDLWDAYVISIMTPVVALANEDIDDFETAIGTHGVDLVHADWQIPPEFKAYVMDWSYSNLDKLFETGQQAGRVFLYGDGKTKPPHINRLLDYGTVFGCPPPKCP
ncbi:MAG TPA: patatin-like phospholipase family protein [Burkholderiales bacterium]|nr:patatin-like phospholipase family protein [Burkholderiales bacterium]